MNDNAKKICNFLNNNNISFMVYEHQPVYTVEDVKNAKLNIPGIPTKNLFLKNKKKTFYCLYICHEDKRIDLKTLSNILGVKGIGFASEEDLSNILNLELGDVGPLGVINDDNNIVKVLIDYELKDKDDINVSANSLSTTLTINYAELEKFMKISGNEFDIVKID